MICILLTSAIFSTSCHLVTPGTSAITKTSSESSLEIIDFGSVSAQGLRIVSMFLWELSKNSGISLSQFETSLEALRKFGNVKQGQAIETLIANQNMRNAFGKSATLAFNFSLMVSGTLKISQVLILIGEGKDPTQQEALFVETLLRKFFSGVGMFMGGALGILFWAASNPNDPMARTILNTFMKISSGGVERLFGYVEWPRDSASSSLFQKLKSRLPNYFAMLPAKLYDGVTGVDEIRTGLGFLCLASIGVNRSSTVTRDQSQECFDRMMASAEIAADVDLLVMLDSLSQGFMYVGNGTCRLWNAFIPGYAANLPGALFSTALFIRQLDGFSNTRLLSALRKPLDDYFESQAKISVIGEMRETLWHSWHVYFLKGKRITDANLRDNIKLGMSEAIGKSDVNPFAAVYSSVSPFLDAEISQSERLRLSKDRVVFHRIKLLELVYDDWQNEFKAIIKKKQDDLQALKDKVRNLQDAKFR